MNGAGERQEPLTCPSVSMQLHTVSQFLYMSNIHLLKPRVDSTCFSISLVKRTKLATYIDHCCGAFYLIFILMTTVECLSRIAYKELQIVNSVSYTG